MGTIIYPCGCRFKTVDRPDDEVLHAEHLTPAEMPRIDVNIYKIKMNCAATWALFGSGLTKGVFQLESYLGKTWSKKVQPMDLEDVAALVALLRPGCLKAMSGDPPKSMTQRYADRKARLEDIAYYHPDLEPILRTTFGVLVYQEQAMKIAVAIAGFNEQEADVLRKAIGKKKPEIMSALENDFVEGCKKKGLVTEEQAKEIFGWIRESQRYSFNKSHAATYGKDSFWTAFMKAHFPIQFFCSYIQGARWKQESQHEVYELVNDAKLYNINVAIPDIRHTKYDSHVIGDTVYFGISGIKNIGASAIHKILKRFEEMKVLLNKSVDEFDWMDYLLYFADSIPITVTQALISAGALDYLQKPRTALLYELNLWATLTDKEKEWIIQQHERVHFMSPVNALLACVPLKKNGGGCHSMRRSVVIQGMITALQNPPHPLVDTADFIAWNENQYLGASITCHKVDACADAAHANTTCKEVLQGKKGYMVLAVEIVSVKELTTKRGKNPGQKMASISMSDHSSQMDNVVCFPTEWSQFSNQLYEGNTVLIQGEKSWKQDSFVVKKVWQI